MSETTSRPSADESRGSAGATAAVAIGSPPHPHGRTEREFTVRERTQTSMVVSRGQPSAETLAVIDVSDGHG